MCWRTCARIVCPILILRDLGAVSINCVQTSRWSERGQWLGPRVARSGVYGDAAYINGKGSVVAIEVAVSQFIWPEVRRQTECTPRNTVPELEFWTAYITSFWQDRRLKNLYYISLLLLIIVQCIETPSSTIMTIDLPGLERISCLVCKLLEMAAA